MNPFLVVIDLDGGTLGLDALHSGLPALSQSDGRVEVLWNGSWAAGWVPSTPFGRPAFAHRHGIYAIGNVRLSGRTNRNPGIDPAIDDLVHIIEEYRRLGPLATRELIGDFSFVLYDSEQRQVLAARDALGVKTVFWQMTGRRLLVSSHQDCLDGSGYDPEFIGHFLVGLPWSTERTVYSRIRRLAPGTVLTAVDDRIVTRQYWSPSEFIGVDRPIDPAEAAREFRRLFTEGVAAQLDDGVPTWSQLSGGLDSSGVVAVAAELAKQGRAQPLGGTVSVVDSLGGGDETRYSNAVLERYPRPNRQLRDFGAWQADEAGPPAFGEPRIFLPFWARSRAMNRAVIDGGGRVILSGFGSDNYLAGPHGYIADLVRQGRWLTAARRITDVAVGSRRSFYRVGFDNAVLPLLPRFLQRRWHREDGDLSPWITPRFAKEHDLADATLGLTAPSAGIGVFGDAQAIELSTIDLALERGISEDGVEMRYPFLHRPLVEFALALPPMLKIGAERKKLVLREGLRDLLPPLVRDRPGKGGIDGRIAWSLTHERVLLDRLVSESRLAEMGCIDRGVLARELSAAQAGNIWSVGPLFTTLALETWLAVRAGQSFEFGTARPAANAAANH
ncbi:MAG: asparagine synthase-related protein [Gemmatimonadales bacterium]